jgi:hypothetical protein
MSARPKSPQAGFSTVANGVTPPVCLVWVNFKATSLNKQRGHWSGASRRRKEAGSAWLQAVSNYGLQSSAFVPESSIRKIIPAGASRCEILSPHGSEWTTGTTESLGNTPSAKPADARGRS